MDNPRVKVCLDASGSRGTCHLRVVLSSLHLYIHTYPTGVPRRVQGKATRMGTRGFKCSRLSPHWPLAGLPGSYCWVCLARNRPSADGNGTTIASTAQGLCKQCHGRDNKQEEERDSGVVIKRKHWVSAGKVEFAKYPPEVGNAESDNCKHWYESERKEATRVGIRS
ncbi:uncharacterized protein BP01DRAFT_153471 [Aspergillus saccharolyticus JOP 1030-1]|uniref:Uncharacterized protein n=1 Tax=Aspergillus saccharolyticus JOP 1030-1 TaxID=1450539 RepID=A0A319AQJ6_9EURO|nr:hypothetical protein BP01DRAFT_153471 [Aspergillus saccharolyticus JOP 1030-1]PYH48672.1 hypothetical protein BP01DRAFT_153471 [Aspergillus saccharolyticus JOP 1030-1]